MERKDSCPACNAPRPTRRAAWRRGGGHAAPHRVPDLQLHRLLRDVDHARPKLHSNGEVVHGLEALVRELQQEAGLPHACEGCRATQ